MKPVYRHYVVERVVAAPREVVWPAVVDWLAAREFDNGAPAGVGAVRRVPPGGDSPGLVEVVLSFEPPWRLVYEIVEGAPVALFQGFVHVVPDPLGCLVMRSFLALRGDDEAQSERFFARAEATLDTWPTRIAAAVSGP